MTNTTPLAANPSTKPSSRHLPRFPFPKGFIWGCSTSSYQIEGAHDVDGRGPSIWDTFCRKPGAVKGGHHGDVACDHYNRWEEDLDLIKSLGMALYRFSVAWPRVFPMGRGKLNPAGLDFYDRIVDGCLARGIEPSVCLYHWDLPQALEEEGGWRVRSTPEAFRDFAAVVAERLGDRVRRWAPINEMPVIIDNGHRTGHHAPGACEPEQMVRQVAHHVLLGHGWATREIRANARIRDVEVGIIHNPTAPLPFTERTADVDLAREKFHTDHGWLMDPMFLGHYPADQWEALGADVPHVEPGDLADIRQPLDYCGLNIYRCGSVVAADHLGGEFEPHYPRTDMDWPIVDDAVYWALRFSHELYAPKALYITENGCAFSDVVDPDGEIRDYARIAYLRGALRGLQRAAAEGMPVRGYFTWSLVDNFEWAEGYTKRFGIVYVDYETQKRTPKASAHWYARVIADNGL